MRRLAFFLCAGFLAGCFCMLVYLAVTQGGLPLAALLGLTVGLACLGLVFFNDAL